MSLIGKKKIQSQQQRIRIVLGHFDKHAKQKITKVYWIKDISKTKYNNLKRCGYLELIRLKL